MGEYQHEKENALLLAALLKTYIKFLNSSVHFKKSNLTWGEKRKLFKFFCCFFIIPEFSSRQHMFWIRTYSLIQDSATRNGL